MNTVEYNRAMSTELGPEPSTEAIEGYILQTLSKGLVVPGYGHAVLRGRDPRLDFLTRFTESHETPSSVEPNGKNNMSMVSLRLIRRAHALVPELLRVHLPRMKNPAPNVDALSGCVLIAYGLEPEALLLFAACSRGMGLSAQYVWDRGSWFLSICPYNIINRWIKLWDYPWNDR
jgi:citrate synthase